MPTWFQRWLNKFDPPKFTGAILPSEKEIAEMPQFSEIVASAAPVEWKPLDLSKLPTYPQYEQNFTFSCVAHADCLEDTILMIQRKSWDIKFSPMWKYLHRVNKPQGGMIGTDVSRIDKMIGSIPYDLLPTPSNENQANLLEPEQYMYEIAKVFQTSDNKINVPIKDFDTLVSIQKITGKPISVWFEFSELEWNSQPYAGVSSPLLRHAVTFIPPRNPGENTYGLLPDGQKVIIIQDSAFIGSTNSGKRVITQAFFEKRNIFTSYKMRFKFEVNPQGLHWDGTMVSLQKCLQSIGFFPMNVAFFENFGPTTKAALAKYQASRQIPVTSMLEDITKSSLLKEF